MLQYNKAGGNVLRGLTRRRQAEKALFDKPVKAGEKESTQSKTSKSSNKMLKVTAKSGLNLRTGAGGSYDKITAIPYNKKVTWVGGEKKTVNGADWYKVTYGSKTGWSMAKWLKQV